MAEFITNCPHCNTKLQVQDKWSGMDTGCPVCKKYFQFDWEIKHNLQ
jgi:hypothetical protein